jgi:hypothetical protein
MFVFIHEFTINFISLKYAWLPKTKFIWKFAAMKVDQNLSPNSLEVADENHDINFHWPFPRKTFTPSAYQWSIYFYGKHFFFKIYPSFCRVNHPGTVFIRTRIQHRE